METTYDVRIWKTLVRKGKRKTTYWVRWIVAGRERWEPFTTKGLAESFRSELLAAARKGEAFNVATGLPVSMERATKLDAAWYDFASSYVDTKWKRSAGTTRRTNAEALTTVTEAMLTTSRGRPDGRVLRSALTRWAFNTARRDTAERPAEIEAALRWVSTHSRPVAALAEPKVLRGVLDAITHKVDGGTAAPSVANRKRIVLNAAINHAIEEGLLTENPIPALKWTPPTKSIRPVDRRSVPNPVQARTLLAAVRAQQPSGPRLVAFFGCIYFAALRPEEVVALAKPNLAIPADGWGMFYLDGAAPHAGRDWTDSGNERDDRRQLKHRDVGDTRPVPCPPELTALLNEHIAEFGFGPDGRLLSGVRGGVLAKITIGRSWERARLDAFTPEVAASPLAATPYHLRHAAISTWVNGGVPVTDAAAWAGHSVDVLQKIYAQCLDQSDAINRQRVEAALGHRRPGR
ncbi:tyrosine-type recombinase/integrase [Cryptosporangium aurantiacum]|uniref:Tyr recombinase domain-containing protein n=1 Tax=Cryptosporangium aurantiacum TaxID=134849 RepID=A0A1M7RJB8_9ACTN|nr:integrase [Cryptosporangium aurantiacum]SHN46435.1 hypothetical protein SAMN05443668_115124 [Cryptosporangium aurantiacum]